MVDYSLSEIFGSVARLGVILSLGSMLVTGFLHGDMMAFAGAGLQYWFMQPIFWNILQVGWGRGEGGAPQHGYAVRGLALRPLSFQRTGTCPCPLRCLPAPPISLHPTTRCPCPARPPMQVNAFCNTDDITWGTKNLDTKRDTTEAKGLMKSGLVYNANQARALGPRLAAAAQRGPGRRAQQRLAAFFGRACMHTSRGSRACLPAPRLPASTAASPRRPRRASLSGRR